MEDASLSASAARVEAAMGKFAAANNAVSSTLSGMLKVTEPPDIARMTIENPGK